MSEYRKVCPVEGCQLWAGRKHRTGEGLVERDERDDREELSLTRHLEEEHPDVDQSLLWDTYEVWTAGASDRAVRVAGIVGLLLLALALVAFVAVARANR